MTRDAYYVGDDAPGQQEIIGEIETVIGVAPGWEEINGEAKPVSPYLHGTAVLGAGYYVGAKVGAKLPKGASPHKAAITSGAKSVASAGNVATLAAKVLKKYDASKRKTVLPVKTGDLKGKPILGSTAALSPVAQKVVQKHVASLANLGNAANKTKAAIKKANAKAAELKKVVAAAPKAVQVLLNKKNTSPTTIHGVIGSDDGFVDIVGDGYAGFTEIVGADDPSEDAAVLLQTLDALDEILGDDADAPSPGDADTDDIGAAGLNRFIPTPKFAVGDSVEVRWSRFDKNGKIQPYTFRARVEKRRLAYSGDNRWVYLLHNPLYPGASGYYTEGALTKLHHPRVAGYKVLGTMIGDDADAPSPGDAAADTAAIDDAAADADAPPVALPPRGQKLSPEDMHVVWNDKVPEDGVIYQADRGWPPNQLGSWNVFYGSGPAGQGDTKGDGFLWASLEGQSVWGFRDAGRWGDLLVHRAPDEYLNSWSNLSQNSAARGWGPLVGNPNGDLANLQFSVTDKQWFWQSANAPAWATKVADTQIAAINKKKAEADQATKEAAAAAKAQIQAGIDEDKTKQDAANALAQSQADTQANIAKQALDAQKAQADLEQQRQDAATKASQAAADIAAAQAKQQADAQAAAAAAAQAAAQADADRQAQAAQLQAQAAQQKEDAAQAELDRKAQEAQLQLDITAAKAAQAYAASHPEQTFARGYGGGSGGGGGDDFGDSGGYSERDGSFDESGDYGGGGRGREDRSDDDSDLSADDG